ncbi:transposase [Streptomyces sp. IMTB 2501]|uniref:transposase n=1 Tax=Streptomyces sp. IMTB 2501 TaxID=1776340 RepID=UPI0026D8EA26
MSTETVRKWRSRFVARRVAGLVDAPRPGRRKPELVLSEAERAELTRWARRAKTAQFLALRARIVLRCADVADGSVISELHRRHRAIEFKKFLVTIDKAVPAGLDVHLVCDNYATHNTAEIKTWLGKHPRFHVHFTPTGSSWMNQVERWSGLMTDKLIRRGVHTSVKALEQDIRAWIHGWNENPRPFTWTKTADEILNSLADHLTKINPPTSET